MVDLSFVSVLNVFYFSLSFYFEALVNAHIRAHLLINDVRILVYGGVSTANACGSFSKLWWMDLYWKSGVTILAA